MTGFWPEVSQIKTHTLCNFAHFTPVKQQRDFAHNYKHESPSSVHVSRERDRQTMRERERERGAGMTESRNRQKKSVSRLSGRERGSVQGENRSEGDGEALKEERPVFLNAKNRLSAPIHPV